jgi:ABC-2 type transport system permease protein
MRVYWVLLKKELRMFFVSPAAYVVLALVMVLNGFAFRAALSILEGAPSEGSIVSWTFQPQWFWLSYFIVFPLLTMRSFAEERRLGTFETLFTAPVRAWQVVGAKFTASLLIYGLMWLPSLANFKIAHSVSAGQVELPAGSLQGSYTILMAMGMFNLAMGIFASSLTRSQIVAAILSFTLSLGHFLLGVFVMVIGRKIADSIVDVVAYFASAEHIRVFTAGLIDSRPLVYYASLTLLFLSFTHQVVEFRRWKP